MKTAWAKLVLLALVCGAGCSTPEISDIVIGRAYKPSNTFRLAGNSPQIRRVAVMPLTAAEISGAALNGTETLEPVLRKELLKTGRYEFVWVTREHLWQVSGRRAWSADEKLPSELLGKIREDFGCDAILFARVTQYHPYPPMAIGWRLQMIGIVEPFPLWAADELYDLGDKRTANGARRFEQKRQAAADKQVDSKVVFYSAAEFAQYSAQSVLSTLPR